MEMLKKIDDNKAVIKLNTGDLGGPGVYGNFDPKGLSAPAGTNDISGTGNVTLDLKQVTEDTAMAEAGLLDKEAVPESDAFVGAHELTHVEKFLNDPQGYSQTPEGQREQQADQNASRITNQDNTLTKKQAEAAVKEILKPKEEKRK